MQEEAIKKYEKTYPNSNTKVALLNAWRVGILPWRGSLARFLAHLPFMVMFGGMIFGVLSAINFSLVTHIPGIETISAFNMAGLLMLVFLIWYTSYPLLTKIKIKFSRTENNIRKKIIPDLLSKLSGSSNEPIEMRFLKLVIQSKELMAQPRRIQAFYREARDGGLFSQDTPLEHFIDKIVELEDQAIWHPSNLTNEMANVIVVYGSMRRYDIDESLKILLMQAYGVKNLDIVHVAPAGSKILKSYTAEALTKIMQGLDVTLKDRCARALVRVAKGYDNKEDEYISKRQWVLREPSEQNINPNGPVARFLTTVDNESLVVFGGAIRNEFLQQEKDTEEFDIAIKAELKDEDMKKIAEKLSKIFFIDKVPEHIMLLDLESKIRSIKPDSEDYRRFMDEFFKQMQEGNDFNRRLDQYIRNAVVDTLRNKEGCTEENLLIRALYGYLLDEAKKEILFVKAFEIAEGIEASLQVQKGALAKGKARFKFNNRHMLIHFIGVVDKDSGRFYATPEHIGVFEEVPELTINRLAVSKEAGVYKLYDQYNGRKDLENGIFRLNFDKYIRYDISLRMIFRIIRFMQQYDFKPNGAVQGLLSRFFLEKDGYKEVKEQLGLQEFVLDVYEHARSIDEVTAYLDSIGALKFIKSRGLNIEEITRRAEIRRQLRQKGVNVADVLSKDLSEYSGSLDIINLLVEKGLMKVVAKKERVVRGALPVKTQAPGYAPAQAPGYAPAQAPGYAPAQAPGSAPAQAPGYAPAQAPGYAPAQAPGYAPAQAPGSAPAQAPGYGVQGPGISVPAALAQAVATGRDLLEAEIDAIDILLGHVEKFESAESPHFELGRKAKLAAARYLPKDYKLGQVVKDFATLDRKIDEMIISELDKRGIRDENIKVYVMKIVKRVREFTPAYLGHPLREDLTYFEYDTLNFRAMELALMAFDKDAGNKAALEANRKNNLDELQKQIEPSMPAIPQLGRMKKIVFLLGENGKDMRDLKLIQQMLEGNPTLALYAISKSRQILNSISYDDVKVLLDTPELKKLHDLMLEGRFVLVKDGPQMHGVDLRYMSEGMADALSGADLIITRGDVNYESLETVKIPVFSLDKAERKEPQQVFEPVLGRIEEERPIMARSERPTSWSEGKEYIEKLIENKEQFVLALADIDHLTRYHNAYGREFQLGGKVRLVMEDAISNLEHEYKGIKIKLARRGPDESIIIISKIDGTEVEKILASEILDRICKKVAQRIYRRLGVATLTNLKGLTPEKIKEIEDMLRIRLSVNRDTTTIIFDINGNELPEDAWERQLGIWNTQLTKMGIQLAGEFNHTVPAFTISIGATESKVSINMDSLLEDVSKSLKQAKEDRNKVVWSSEGSIAEVVETIKTETETEVSEIKEPVFVEPVKTGEERFKLFVAKKQIRALLLLKGGEFGGLEHSVRQRILERLKKHYNVTIGARYAPSKKEVLRRWGLTGLTTLLENIKGIITEEEFNIGKNHVLNLEADEFDNWLREILDKYQDPRVRGLAFLWHHLQEDVQYLYLERKVDRKKILDEYGMQEEEANQLLGADYNSVSEQVFVNRLLIGPAETEQAPPGTLRNLVYEELTNGALKKTAIEGRAWGAAGRTIMASANGIHSAGTDAELMIDLGFIPDTDTILFDQFISGATGERSPPERILAKIATSTSGEEIPSLNLNETYHPTQAPQQVNARGVIEDLSRITSDLENEIQGDDFGSKVNRYLLDARRNYLIGSVQDAYKKENKGRYTFYHALIAITRLLPYIVKNIDDTRTNIYLARDGANYWLTKRMMEGDNFDASKNIIFHLSRERLGTAMNAMEEMLNEVKKLNVSKEEFFDKFMEMFSAKVAADAEFKEKVDEVYKDLMDAGIAGGDINKFRIVDSMSEGVITGFLKAVILYKQAQIPSSSGEVEKKTDVEEFIIAPKYDEMARLRGVKTFKWPEEEITKSSVEQWFKDEGLEAPTTLTFDTIEEQSGTKKQEFNADELIRTALEAMVYHLQYPYSELNLGHPINYDSKDGKIRISSPAKKLGAHLREILIANSVARYKREAVPATETEDKEWIKQFSSLVSVPDFLDDLYLGLTDKEKEDFNKLIMAHNEVFATTSDTKQVELLYNLAEFIHVMGEEVVKQIIELEEKDPHYKYLFEMFLFEMRQLNYEEFNNAFTQWLLGGKDTTRQDFVSKSLDPEEYYNIENFIAKMRQLRREPSSFVVRDKSVGESVRRGLPFLRATAYGKDGLAVRKIAGAIAEEIKVSSRSNLVPEMFDSTSFLEMWKERRQNDVHLSLFSRFIDADGVEFTMHDLEVKIGQEEAEKLLKSYVQILNERLSNTNWILSNKSGEKYQGLRGSVAMYLIPSDVEDKDMAYLIDEVANKFNESNEKGYKLKLNAFMIDSPTHPHEIEELYNALLEITSLPVTYEGLLENTVSRVAYKEALQAVIGERQREADIDFLMQWEKDKVESEITEDSYIKRYTRKSPENEKSIRDRNLATIAAFLDRRAPDETREKINIYLVYLKWAFRQN